LNRLLPLVTLQNVDDDDDDDDTLFGIFSMYNVRYIAPLAGLRLFILILPLLFHSYTGTALNYMLLYQWFYLLTMVILIIHVTSLALLNPSSIETMVPIIQSVKTTTPSLTNMNDDEEDEDLKGHSFRSLIVFLSSMSSSLCSDYLNEDDHHRTLLMDHFYELRRIWWMLTLSIISVCCHWILLWHVRSTAPPHLYFGYRKPSVYFAVRTASSYANHNNNQIMSSIAATIRDSPLTFRASSSYNRHHPNESAANEQAMIHAMNGMYIFVTNVFLLFFFFYVLNQMLLVCTLFIFVSS
jgi:hypothetical protein